ncbi:E3 ubiquitin-protein ligase RNF144B-like isoform X2 [Phalaenopsis equestris]|uniref:E3 ubiquitin-protein ligase RNF144B-like isoform X2 n=2 Tax=Phalaenopsis equestris TaxID=78828 RepID=UPI0009E37E9C|nr:E3 ubiquitin-protein ligase RNF144B-like isoform X2 [Phalaenopsis equestris]
MVSHYSKFKEEIHRFCLYCLKYLLHLDGYPATCIFCGESLKDEEYWHVLSPSHKAMVSMLRDEKAIPVKERAYCANQQCSALHSKAEARLPQEELAKLCYDASGLAECKKCKQRFCLNCHVPWHDLMSCDDYKKSVVAAELEADDRKLYRLAEKKFWVTCSDCERIIEHDGGCDNVHCRRIYRRHRQDKTCCRRALQ